MSFFAIFTKVGRIFGNPAVHTVEQIGAAVVGAYNPGLGALVESIANAIYAVESTVPADTTGEAKKDQVKAIINVAAPVTIQTLQTISGKKITDPSAIAPALDSLIDSVVEVFNEIGVFIKAVKTPPATPAAAAPPPAK